MNRAYGKLIIRWALVLGLAATGYLCAEAETPATSLQLRDVAFIPGGPLTLTGYGLVVNLPGTGDGALVGLTDSTLCGSIRRLGIDIGATAIHVRDVATVLLTATVAAGYSTQQKLDVNLIALGDAPSLAGGVLLPTTLTSADGAITATAGGPLTDAISQSEQGWAGARLQSGALLAAPAFRTAVPSESVELALKPNLTDGQKSALVDAVNSRVGIVLSLEGDGLVCLSVPEVYGEPTECAALLDALAVTPLDLSVEGLVASLSQSATNGELPTQTQGW
jgi:flagellar basal body P-ring protein FlgI